MLKPEIKDFVGFHIGGPREILYGETIPEYRDLGFKVFQVFLHSPKIYVPPRVDTFRFYKNSIPLDCTIIAHSPYIISPVSDNNSEIYKRTVFNTAKALEVCDFMGYPYYVMHCGGVREYEGKKQGYDNLRNFCYSVMDYIEEHSLNVSLCLENDPGSSTGKKIGSISLLYKLIKEINDLHIRMAYDTEHGYANGFDFSNDFQLEKTKSILDVSSVVHLNSIPEKVQLGKHLDRHSETLLEESKTGSDSLFGICLAAIRLKRYIILERDNYDYVAKDIKFLEERFESVDFDIVDAELVCD